MVSVRMVLKQNVLLRAIIVTVLPQFGKGVKVVSVKSDTRTPLNANQPEAIMSITLQDCFGHVCHPVEEFCSSFAESCMQCAQVCDMNSEPNQLEICAKECAEFNRFEFLRTELSGIRNRQVIILSLLVVLMAFMGIFGIWKCFRWLREKRFCSVIVKKLMRRCHSKKDHLTVMVNGKDLGTTIPNRCAINDMDTRATHVCSVTGAEGSVITVTTPISTRHPAENATPPTSQPSAEYSYDNQALAVTPIHEKRNGSTVF